MSTIAKVASGTLLKIGDAASSENFTTVPEVTKIAGPDIKFDLLDATSHDLGGGVFREFIPGLADGDMISFDCHWRPANAVHKGIRVDQYARTKRNFQLVFPDTSDNTVLSSTYIQSFAPKADVGQILEGSGKLKITGAPVWS